MGKPKLTKAELIRKRRLMRQFGPSTRVEQRRAAGAGTKELLADEQVRDDEAARGREAALAVVGDAVERVRADPIGALKSIKTELLEAKTALDKVRKRAKAVGRATREAQAIEQRTGALLETLLEIHPKLSGGREYFGKRIAYEQVLEYIRRAGDTGDGTLDWLPANVADLPRPPDWLSAYADVSETFVAACVAASRFADSLRRLSENLEPIDAPEVGKGKRDSAIDATCEGVAMQRVLTTAAVPRANWVDRAIEWAVRAEWATQPRSEAQLNALRAQWSKRLVSDSRIGVLGWRALLVAP